MDDAGFDGDHSDPNPVHDDFSRVYVGPYGETEHLPVAVVNNDKAVSYNGTKMEVGKELISNLKKSDVMDFRFVNEAEADSKLRSGTY